LLIQSKLAALWDARFSVRNSRSMLAVSTGIWLDCSITTSWTGI